MKQKQTLANLVLLLNLLIVLVASSAFASPGDIDSTFRSGGFVTSDFGGAAYTSAVQADDKLIIVGRTSGSNGGSEFTLLRYNSDGTLDISFGTNGRVTKNIEGDNEIPFAAAIQPDGKIVVVGQFQNGGSFQYDFGIIRYNSDGTLDTSFGTNGKTSISIGDSEDIARSIIIQPDGKLLVGGSAYFAGGTAAGRFAIVRFNTNGTIDTTFDADGKVIVQQNGFGDIALQPDGKIIVASSDGYSSDSNFAVSRLNGDGSLDTNFGNAGKTTTGFGDGGSSINSIRMQPDGKIVAAGVSHVNGSQTTDFGLARYNSNGSLDTSFDGDGKVITSFGDTDDTANKIILQPDNKIVVTGVAQGNNNSQSKGTALARYNADGSLDLFFGNNGKTTANLLGGDYAYDAELQSDGKIVTVGTGGGSPQRFIAIRFTANGAPDQNFNTGVGGHVTATLGATNSADDVVIQPDGKILIVGATLDYYGSNDFALVRLNADGTPDLTFGVGGKVRTSISSSIDGALAVALQPDGKIVTAGYAGTPGNTDVAVVRYNSDGTLDKTFDNDGIVILPRQNVSDAANDIVIQADGKIVIAGYTSVNNSYNFFLARFILNGSLDSTFGVNGFVTTNIGAGDDFAKALVQQNDGKLIAAGTSRSSGGSGDFAVVRYTSNGELDSTFGTNGKVVTPIGNANDDALAAVLQTDGKIVVAGNTDENLKTNIALVRYNSNGLLDGSFGDGGKTITVLSSSTSVAEDVIVQPNGRIVVVGGRFNGSMSDIAVFRYNSSGLLDMTFGTSGAVFLDFNNNREYARAVTFQGTGKLIVAGGSYKVLSDSPQSEIFVLRYQANTETNFDFDGDGKTDISIYRPSLGEWWYQKSSTSGNGAFQFGSAADKMTPADFTGDGKSDFAFFRPSSGEWFVLRSEDSSFYSFPFGTNGDIPVPADYDGDGRTDAAVFRPSTNTWYISKSTGGTTIQSFGSAGDVPVVSDYDGDGKADIAIYRSSKGEWWIQKSSGGTVAFQFGNSTDKPVQSDYTGDGKADVAFFRPSTGEWFILRSENSSYYSFPFGTNGDVPSPGDYDGDGKTDAAVFRPSNSVWYIQKTSGGVTIQGFGQTGDQSVPNAFVP